jgi:hypothetical protein
MRTPRLHFGAPPPGDRSDHRAREIADSFADAIWHAETQMFNGHDVGRERGTPSIVCAGPAIVYPAVVSR